MSKGISVRPLVAEQLIDHALRVHLIFPESESGGGIHDRQQRQQEGPLIPVTGILLGESLVMDKNDGKKKTIMVRDSFPGFFLRIFVRKIN